MAALKLTPAHSPSHRAPIHRWYKYTIDAFYSQNIQMHLQQAPPAGIYYDILTIEISSTGAVQKTNTETWHIDNGLKVNKLRKSVDSGDSSDWSWQRSVVCVSWFSLSWAGSLARRGLCSAASAGSRSLLFTAASKQRRRETNVAHAQQIKISRCCCRHFDVCQGKMLLH